MINEAEILEDIKNDSDEYRHVILGTHSFDPVFFESILLPLFRLKDAESILVLSDRVQYQERFLDMRSAGNEYYIDHCYASKVFHPKFAILLWPEGVKLILGSANLTKQEWFESGEIVGSLTHYFSKPDAQSERVLSEFRDFLSKMIEKNYIKSKKHRSKLSKVIENLPASHADKKLNVHLLHNIEKPILSQLEDIIDKSIKSVKIVAPVFDADGSVFDFFIKKGCKKFQIFIQPGNVTGFPKKKIKNLLSHGCSVEVNKISFKENESRLIHAKIMILKTAAKSFCLYGSANPTFSGMLSTPKNGNLELCVLSRSKPGHYDSLVENDRMLIESISVDDIVDDAVGDVVSDAVSDTADSPEPSHLKPESNTITIHDAYLDKKKLVLETDKPPVSANIVLRHVDEESCTIPVNTQEKIFAIDLDDEQFVFCSKPTYVQIRLRKSQDESNRRWISTQTLELIPRKSDIEKLQLGGGRFGLISFLDKLEKFVDEPEWFYYHLSRFRLDDPSTLERGRRKYVLISDDGTYNERPPETDIVSAFKKKFEKSSEGIKKSLHTMTEFNRDEFESQFNQFLAWSKMVYWLNMRDEKYLNYLRFVRTGMEEFLVLLSRTKHDKTLQKYLSKINFWQHFLLLSFMTYTFQKKAGFLRTNPGVLRVFNETTTQMISTLDSDIIFTKDDFKSVVEEYSEFKNLEIDLDAMSRFYEDFERRFLKF